MCEWGSHKRAATASAAEFTKKTPWKNRCDTHDVTGRGNLTSRFPLIISLSYIGIMQIALDSNKKELTSCNHCRPKKVPIWGWVACCHAKSDLFSTSNPTRSSIGLGSLLRHALPGRILVGQHQYIRVYIRYIRKYCSSNSAVLQLQSFELLDYIYIYLALKFPSLHHAAWKNAAQSSCHRKQYI